MKLQKDSAHQGIDITDYYAVKVGSIWKDLKKENAALWCLCIYVFFEYVRPQSIYPAIDILPWTKIAIIIASIIALMSPSIKWVSNPQNKLLTVLFCIIALSSTYAFHPALSWNKISIVINWALVYFLIITVINTEKRLIIFILLFLLANFKMSQHGFSSFASRGFSFASYGVTGSPGWFANSGEFGITMTIFVPLSIAFILALKQNWGIYKKLFFYFMPFTGLMTIVATSSRGAQLAIVVVGVWFLMKSRFGLKAIIGVVIIGWGLISYLPEEQMERFSSMGEDETSTQRLEYWEFGLDIMQDHPWLGIGYSNWLEYCWFIYPNGLGYQAKCEMSHNSFVEAGSELGIPGLLIFLIMLTYVFILNAKTRKYAKEANNKLLFYLAHGLDGGLVGYLVSGFFIAAFFYPFFWFQLPMTVALFEITKKKLREHEATGNLPGKNGDKN